MKTLHKSQITKIEVKFRVNPHNKFLKRYNKIRPIKFVPRKNANKLKTWENVKFASQIRLPYYTLQLPMFGACWTYHHPNNLYHPC